MARRLGANTRRRRLELGLSLNDLAKRTRIDKGSLSRIENARTGRRGLGTARLEVLAKALSVEPAQLLGHGATVTGTKQ
jgi:transcriptional regulator with XRE-family HTH domain